MIKFLDLKQLNDQYQAEILAAAERVIKSGWYIKGEELDKFEREFADYCGAKYCVGVGNGLDALTLSLRAWKEQGRLAPGDEVIVPANTYIASILAIIESGLKPILVEPSLDDYNIDFEKIESKIRNKTRVLLPVHLYGQLAEMDKIKQLANANNLIVLEDAAQAHGAEAFGGRAGALGDAAGFSFYPGKNLGALGDGGAITTNDAEFADIVRSLGNYGSEIKYQHKYRGINSRLDELQAAILSVKLKHLDGENTRRRQIAQRYISEIGNETITLPNLAEGKKQVWHLFVIRCADRKVFMNYLSDNGVQSQIHYPTAPHLQPGLIGLTNEHFPITEKIHDEVVSLPLNPTMSDDEVSHVIKVCNAFGAS
ncbi:DegT/DnrJ/EryC1/StrS family aminotransferase [Pseudomonas asplenii]|uniref:dTDP-4-amino-4,6-dideoxygalactose transaminase n=1 Tax=Pseudomonas asplenii TaxID=53407 RepID=A0A1H6MFL3_9PSED|nr:DegT/DnrJ/EryC1/StrS family aminotransferase [Pseudomonas fuscovaginae]SEH97809.1 dTDP-4-amino-4,6-dideoxygalactose transaminase [Pseudomonas fuscovaginae]